LPLLLTQTKDMPLAAFALGVIAKPLVSNAITAKNATFLDEIFVNFNLDTPELNKIWAPFLGTNPFMADDTFGSLAQVWKFFRALDGLRPSKHLSN
jgi:hypothetical protein